MREASDDQKMSSQADGAAREAARLVEAACDGVAPRLPRATYRVQLNKDFTFEQARRVVAYLDALGVSDLYSSPFFKARPESLHGYDLVDHNALNPAIGGRDDLDRLTGELAAHAMGLLLDFVPNHMGVGTSDNAWWNDVLENGPSSLYAPFFDIDWAPLKTELKQKVLLPVLGDHYGRVLERGELKIEFENGAFVLRYFDHVFPVNPRTYAMVIGPLVPGLTAALGEEHDALLELQSILTGLRNLPPRTETQRAKVIERRREKEVLKRRLATLVADSPDVAAAVAEGVERINGKADDPRSFDPLEALLEEQAYRLSFWRTAAEEINYRRFFDINELAAIKMEHRPVFSEAHRLVFELCERGQVTGLRIDHPDGLWDPIGYFEDLQRGYLVERCRRRFLADAAGEPEPRSLDDARRRPPAAGRFAKLEPAIRAALEERVGAGAAHGAQGSSIERPVYVVVEKILARGETLPEAWPIHGTSGYDFTAAVGELFVDSSSEASMTAIYERFIGDQLEFDTLVYEKKKVILRTALASELNVLTHALNRLTERDRRFRDFTLGSLNDALREVIACFPVYRTYVNERTPTISDHDRVAIGRAIALARRRNPTMEATIFTFLRSVLMLDPDLSRDGDRRPFCEFVMKFQQLTGPVMAKGLEDTSFYIYNRLVSLNEVGGEPERYGASVLAFHRANVQRQKTWPYSMLATSTHDTKRSEDVRARISVLSEIPSDWEEALQRAASAAAPLKAEIEGRLAPDSNEEYLFYQTLLGSLPIEPLLGASSGPRAPEGDALSAYTDRLVDYMRKATKEAKVNTSWIDAQPEYDAAVEAFVRKAIASADVLGALLPLARVVAYHGMWGSLSQTLLKLTSPGVPDIYQGNEVWDFSLVDPDNRRAVDYASREEALAEIRARWNGGDLTLARELCAEARDGRIKLFVTHVALELRRRHPALFGADGAYAPRAVIGERETHVVAFARRDPKDGRSAVVIAPRFSARLLGGASAPPTGKVWAGTFVDVEPGIYTDLFTGAEIEASPSASLPRDAVATSEPKDGAALPLDRVLSDFPVALLVRATQRGQ
ncbi:malto-oligosyltrehalose synthase [Sorangium cellulosum]|uniref:Malto-oligosyltrehalose synthase n=1 Tax=Sorangium cellulosum TaxID=56 RepID=A0A150TIV6_SORCE|nr:malto-oligosyltrehalose synthase [Sorangium cellulosum]